MPTVNDILQKLRGLMGGRSRRSRLDDFVIYGQTAKGSMSRVYRARDPLRNIIVAIKILDPERAATVRKINTHYRDETEGQIAIKLRHPNLVVTYETGKTKADEYIIMEYLDGVALNYLIDTLSPRLVGKRIAVMRQFAEGMAYIHGQGYAHRDICPRNVMVMNDNTPKIIDFGLTVPLKPEFMKPGNRTGTPTYLAPELIRRHIVDHKVDIFAFGVSMYECFVGKPPWTGVDSMAKLMAHLNVEPPNPHVVNPALSTQMSDLILDAMHPNPNRRIPDMAQVIERLTALESGPDGAL